MSKDISEQKKSLRKEIRAREEIITDSYRLQASRTITDLVTALPEYKYADVIFCFAGEGTEPDTSGIVNRALEDGKTVCMPLCVTDKLMEAKRITDPSKDLRPGRYGIPEPSSDLQTISSDEIDLGIIPCVTCDHLGNRLGHGKGYYDRFLEGEDMAKVMLCMEMVTVDDGRIPMGELDLPIEVLVTEDGVFRN